MSHASDGQSGRSVFTEASVHHQHHADSRTSLRLTPSSPVKDQTRKGRSLGANSSFPIDQSSFARRARRFRGASAPLARLATNAALQRSRGGGGDRNRTDDLLLAKQALSQLSYTPSVLSGCSRSKSQSGISGCGATARAAASALTEPFSALCRFRGASAPLTRPDILLRKSRWWAREDLNLRPHAYQARALTN